MLDDKDIQMYLEKLTRVKSEKQSLKEPAIANMKQPLKAHVDPSCDIRGVERIQLGRNVVIQKDCWLNIAYNHPHPGPMIIIGDGTNIGRRCTLSAANMIHIGKFVLFAPNVFVADTHHEYQKIEMPIMHQGITTASDRVIIGDETWIGINSVIMGNVLIGKHSVIGANSVVTRDIPDYCVAVGNPVKIIKVLNIKTMQWVRIYGEADLQEQLAARPTEKPADNSTR